MKNERMNEQRRLRNKEIWHKNEFSLLLTKDKYNYLLVVIFHRLAFSCSRIRMTERVGWQAKKKIDKQFSVHEIMMWAFVGPMSAYQLFESNYSVSTRDILSTMNPNRNDVTTKSNHKLYRRMTQNVPINLEYIELEYVRNEGI